MRRPAALGAEDMAPLPTEKNQGLEGGIDDLDPHLDDDGDIVHDLAVEE